MINLQLAVIFGLKLKVRLVKSVTPSFLPMQLSLARLGNELTVKH
jgi:hypothetical protein